MKYEEILQKFGRKAPQAKRAHPRDLEHQLQAACIHWFRYAYSRFGDLLFAIPNGGRRDAITGKRLKEEGVLAGVADLFLSMPNNEFHGLYIEMKTATGRQSKEQKAFEQNVSSQGYLYFVCRSKEEFISIINTYFSNYVIPNAKR